MLKRKTPLKAKKPMARKPIKRSLSSKNPAYVRDKKAKRQRMRDKRWRSEQYLAFVKSQPCCNCLGPGRDPHHVIGLHWGLSGQGLTAPDSFAMSLCRACHDAVHRSPELQHKAGQRLARAKASQDAALEHYQSFPTEENGLVLDKTLLELRNAAHALADELMADGHHLAEDY